MPPCHGACKCFAVLRARAAPGLRRRARSPSSFCGGRSRRPGVNAGRAHIQHNRLLPGQCRARSLAARCAARPAQPALALSRAVHARHGYVWRPGPPSARSVFHPARLTASQCGHALRASPPGKSNDPLRLAASRSPRGPSSSCAAKGRTGSPRLRGRTGASARNGAREPGGRGDVRSRAGVLARGRADSLCVCRVRQHAAHVQAAGAPDITDRCVQCEPARRRCAARWPAWSSSAASDGQHATRGYVECGLGRTYPGRLPGRGGLDARCGLLQRPQNARR